MDEVFGVKGAYYAHGCVPEAFLDELAVLAESIVEVDNNSHNMVCERKWFNDEEIAAKVLKCMPNELGMQRVLPSMRFLRYAGAGFIKAHTDGQRFDDKTNKPSTTSFLLYMSTCEQGGTTDFLESMKERDQVVNSIAPRRGSILVFPHETAHAGDCVIDAYPKILLRGDAY